MKTDIHLEYMLATVRCSCGNEFQTRSTKSELHVEVCSACHPFYTGKQKLVDTGGRVERFERRPGRPRGRDDAQSLELGTRGTKAGRRDRRGQPSDSLGDGAPLVLPA